MKKYIDAELQIVHMNNRDIVTESGALGSNYTGGDVEAADRFRDWD